MRVFSLGTDPVSAEDFDAVTSAFNACDGKAHGFRIGVAVCGADVVRAARSMIGAKWRHQARRPDAVDCIGLGVMVRRMLGLPHIDVVGYTPTAADSSMLDFCRMHFVEVDRKDIRPGDVLVQMAGVNRHMAIVADYPLGGLSIVHAWIGNRKVVECRLDDTFMQTVRGCFRFPEIA